jgi:hypothetical protein
MDAAPYLQTIAELLERHAFEAILIGNAAAAIQGAPVTTVDMDFLFRKTPANIKKLKAITRDLDAVLLRPFYPAVDLFRIERDSDRLQLDFMTAMDGISSFEGLRRRATRVSFGNHSVLVGSLADIIKSKKAAGRPQDLAVMYVLEAALAKKENQQDGASGSAKDRK